MIKINFIQKDGSITSLKAQSGMSLMVTAIDNNIAGIKAICNGCCSCGTCHIELSPDVFDKASTKYSGEEQVLKNLKKRTPYSRLACQVIVDDKLEGAMIKVK